tara:strand:+ start:207 stop:578 length:372 start_codon:yes stop_codon:yes gene_type:complete
MSAIYGTEITIGDHILSQDSTEDSVQNSYLSDIIQRRTRIVNEKRERSKQRKPKTKMKDIEGLHIVIHNEEEKQICPGVYNNGTACEWKDRHQVEDKDDIKRINHINHIYDHGISRKDIKGED